MLKQKTNRGSVEGGGRVHTVTMAQSNVTVVAQRVLNQGGQPQYTGLAQQTTKREMLTRALRKQPACSLLFNTL